VLVHSFLRLYSSPGVKRAGHVPIPGINVLALTHRAHPFIDYRTHPFIDRLAGRN
jgi:hypothetical protein